MKKIIMLAMLTLALCVPALAQEDLTVILDYVANTNHTGLYVALDQLWYKDEGLDIHIVEPTGGATGTLIAVGAGQIGISYQEDVTVARAAEEPLPIRAIAAIIQHNTSGFASFAGRGIASPKDFEGKTYAGWGGPGEEAVLRAVMERAGADFNKLNRVISDGTGFAALKDRADIMWFYEAWDNVKCSVNGFAIDYMPIKDLDPRLDYYTPVVITSEDMIANRPDALRAFLRATTRGYAYAAAHPDEAAKILAKYAPDYDIEMLTQSQRYLADKYIDDAPRFGEMKQGVWDAYTGFCLEYGVIARTIAADQLFTNEFLPEAHEP